MSKGTNTRPDGESEAPRTVAGNFRSVFVGRLISAFSMWVALVILAKLSDPATVGLYSLAQAICIPIAEVAKMGLRDLRSSEAMTPRRYGLYVSLRLLGVAVAFGLVAAAALYLGATKVAVSVILVYGLIRCIEMLSDMIYSIFQACERMEFIGRSLCLVGPASLVMLAFGYMASGSLLVGVIGQFLAHLAVFVFYDLPHGRRFAGPEGLRADRSPRKVLGLAVVALPLTFATLMMMIAQFAPRLAVESILGQASLGIFAALLALAMAPDRLIKSLGVALSIRLAHQFAGGEFSKFKRILVRICLFIFLASASVILGSILVGEDILRIIYTQDYAEQNAIFVLLLLAATARLLANFIRLGLVAARSFWWVTAQSAIAAVTAVVASFALIPGFGLTGAAIVVLLTGVVQFAVSFTGMVMTLRTAEARSSDHGP